MKFDGSDSLFFYFFKCFSFEIIDEKKDGGGVTVGKGVGGMKDFKGMLVVGGGWCLWCLGMKRKVM